MQCSLKGVLASGGSFHVDDEDTDDGRSQGLNLES